MCFARPGIIHPSMHKFLALLTAIAPLSGELEDYLHSIIKLRIVARKEVLVREGELAKNIYFVESGLVRSYFQHDVEEINFRFFKEGDLIIISSFLLQEPSFETIAVLESGKLWAISFEQLHFIYKHYPEFNYHRGTILEKYFGQREKKHFLINQQTTAKRYENLLKQDPDLLRRVPGKHLASYLGTTASYLSEMRSAYARRKQNHRSK